MQIRGIVLLAGMTINTVNLLAQDVREAYNLSNLTVQGTARSMGFGNTLGSVGGDFSSLSVNPAGIGVYRSSEFSFTPSLRINSATGDYAGSTSTDNNARFGFNNLSLVFTNAPKGPRYDKRSWKAVSFGIGMNKVADFNRNYSYFGKNNTSSASQAFESDANWYPTDALTTDPSNALGSIGYQSYLLNQNLGNEFYSVVPYSGGINQMKSVEERGAINEIVISLGGNYKEKLLLGATVGVPSVRYKKTSYYTENVASGNTNNPENFSSFTYGNKLDISGNGVNLKLGAIYKFSKFFRAGIAFHTPTFYSITDEFDPSMTSVVNGQTTILNTLSGGGLIHNQFDYRFSTPYKAVLSATIMLNTFGFITADYEYVDYSAAKYYFSEGHDLVTGQSFKEQADAINREIGKTYGGVSNFRLGAEGRLGKFFMVRAGFGYYGDPYTSYGKSVQPAAYTTERIDISCGFGFHFHHFFTDMGYVHSMYQGFEQPYAVDYSGVVSGPAATVPTAKMNYSLNNFAWTIGVKF